MLKCKLAVHQKLKQNLFKILSAIKEFLNPVVDVFHSKIFDCRNWHEGAEEAEIAEQVEELQTYVSLHSLVNTLVYLFGIQTPAQDSLHLFLAQNICFG